MTAPRERIEFKALAPATWRFGWVGGFLVFFGVTGIFSALHHSVSIGSGPIALVLAAIAATTALFVWPARVVLGEDGLTVRRYGTKRFILYSAIEATEVLQRLGNCAAPRGSGGQRTWNVITAVRLKLRDGSHLDIGMGTEERDLTQSRVLAVGMVGNYGALDKNAWKLSGGIDERVRDTRKTPPPATTTVASLMRGSRSVSEWLATLAASLQPAASADVYRGSEGTVESMWRVLEDDAAPRDARAAAAFALRRHLDDDNRTRMQIVVESCESPKLRIAVETALDEEAGEERILYALEQASVPRAD